MGDASNAGVFDCVIRSAAMTMSIMEPLSVTLGAYVSARLAQLGCVDVFGLPGDFNLTLLDEMLESGALTWRGSANELDAAYAADGYARIRRGIGALVTTYGVGELSAVNGIAGSFAEDVPVVHIVGMPERGARLSDALLHHTLADGDHDHFLRMQAEISATVEVITSAATAAATIDRALTVAVGRSKPVYLGIPADLAAVEIDALPLAEPLRGVTHSDPAALAWFGRALEEALTGADSLSCLLGVRAARFGGELWVQRLAELDGVRVAHQFASKALVDDAHPANLGTYAGALTGDDVRSAVEGADVVVAIGTVDTDFLTGFFSQNLDATSLVRIDPAVVSVGGDSRRGILLEDAVATLHDALAARPPRAARAPGTPSAASAGALDASVELRHEVFWPALERHIPAGAIVAAEAGTAYYGAVSMALPSGCDFLGQPVWASIGFTLPAALGASIAAPDRPVMLVIGDGAAQLTIAELGSLLSRPSGPTVLVLNNGGYTVERLIRSPRAPYQDIPHWDWTRLPAALGAPDAFVATVRTVGELDDALRAAADAPGALIEVMLPTMDAPELLARIAGGVR